MKIHLIAAASFLLISRVLSAREAWLLEMDSRLATMLLEKCEAVDKASYRQALGKLPELVESGTISEIERVAVSETDAGGVHFPRQSVTRTIGGEESTRSVGSVYLVGPERWRNFEIATFESSPAVFRVSVSGPLSKEWMPVVAVEKAGRVRILFERDPDSSEEFQKTSGRLSIAAPFPEPLAVTWLLTAEQIASSSAGAGSGGPGSPIIAFTDVTEVYQEDQRAFRELGTNLTLALQPDGGLRFILSQVTARSGKEAGIETFEASGEMDGSEETTKHDVSTRLEMAAGEGASDVKGRDIGPVVCGWSRVPAESK